MSASAQEIDGPQSDDHDRCPPPVLRPYDRALLDGLAWPAAVLAPDGVVVAVNPAWRDDMADVGVGPWFPRVGSDYPGRCETSETPEGSLLGAGVRAVCGGRRTSFELDLAISGAERMWFRLSARPLAPPLGGALVTAVDVTSYQQVADLLAERGMHDPLTGLANRALLFDHLQLALDHVARREGVVVAVAFVDLDNFKLVNDVHGHAVGDRLLQEVAKRLDAAVREEDTVARLGGDEFVVLFGEMDEDGLERSLADRLRDCLDQPITVSGRSHRISASVGCTISAPGATAESILGQADEAMYRAKEAGKGRVVQFGDRRPGR